MPCVTLYLESSSLDFFATGPLSTGEKMAGRELINSKGAVVSENRIEKFRMGFGGK